MELRLCFCRPTVNRLAEVWQRALRRGDRRVVRRVTALLQRAEYTRPLLRPALAFVALGLALIVGSWLWDHRGRW